jgi:predicted RNA binding protein YcfA (HicA-like mRNA interferase family)
MSPRIVRMTAREVEALLRRHGFRIVSQRGSHRKWRNPERGLLVIVPEHRGRRLPLGTPHNILVNAGIPEGDWKR